ncbi:short-chain dehydrogenase/reductase [Mycobacterium sp. 1100029.7]|nr:short-chain dehydrogenase/reductase [Mycobacterium sp. 1100029.7]
MVRVLITGSSRGIGKATAIALAEQGHEVVATARDVSSLAGLPVAQRLELDVTSQESVDAAIEQSGRVDVLISNAGATVRAPLETIPLTAVRELFELNTFGALRVAQAVLPQMRERRSGQLIFMSSVQGQFVIPLIGAYGATKHALEALAEAVAIEAGHFGVSVHIVQPPAVASGGAERAQVYLDDDNPYRALLGQLGAFRTEPVEVDDVTRAVSDVINDGPRAALRIPVGETAAAQLAARKAAPNAEPFLVAPLDW